MHVAAKRGGPGTLAPSQERNYNALGVMQERLLGFDRGHAELLASVDGWLSSLEEKKA